MKNLRSEPFRIRAFGPLAMFTNPLATSERWSYDVMTPPAARGLLDAVLWHPGMRWVVERIGILAEIRHISIRLNEVKNATPVSAKPYYVDQDRTQRNNLLLRDVDYLIVARIELTPSHYQHDSIGKFVNMFTERMNKGQHYRQPYFGCTDYPATVLWHNNEPVLPITKDLGMVNCGFWKGPAHRGSFVPAFWPAQVVNGYVDVPYFPMEEAC